MWGTFPDRTFRSGSAIVIMTPIRKLTTRMIVIFRDFVSVLPRCSPITTIELSEPYIKMLSPKISRTLPTTKESMASVATGAARKAMIQTIIPMCITDFNDSLSLLISILFLSMVSPRVTFSYQGFMVIMDLWFICYSSLTDQTRIMVSPVFFPFSWV